jgi:hypothetical protein
MNDEPLYEYFFPNGEGVRIITQKTQTVEDYILVTFLLDDDGNLVKNQHNFHNYHSWAIRAFEETIGKIYLSQFGIDLKNKELIKQFEKN